MVITDKTLDDFVQDLHATLLPLQDKYGVSIQIGNISYTEERFSTKLTVTNGQNTDEIEKNNFDADVWRFAHLGLERGMFNRIFLAPDGSRLALRGFNTRAPKYPIIALRLSDGQKVRCKESHIHELTDEYYGETSSALDATAAPPEDNVGTPADTMLKDSGTRHSNQAYWEQFVDSLPEPRSTGIQSFDQLKGIIQGNADKKPGPNDPCPCGSGKKYKKCCGR